MRNRFAGYDVLVVIGNEKRAVLETTGAGAFEGRSILSEVDAEPG
jgi:hypothetical protein